MYRPQDESCNTIKPDHWVLWLTWPYMMWLVQGCVADKRVLSIFLLILHTSYQQQHRAHLALSAWRTSGPLTSWTITPVRCPWHCNANTNDVADAQSAYHVEHERLRSTQTSPRSLC